jgi:DNA invertase Pin-like site-specific DNA recombinase
MIVFHQLQRGRVAPRRAALSARVSTHDQHTLAMPRDALHECATHRDWTVIATVAASASGAPAPRPQRHARRTAARPRQLEVMLGWKRERWGRARGDLMTMLPELTALGVGFGALPEALELTTPAGRACASFLAVGAACERDVLCERLKAGLTEARQRGQAPRRPRATANEAAHMRARAQPGLRPAAMARPLGVWRTSVRRVWAQQAGRCAACPWLARGAAHREGREALPQQRRCRLLGSGLGAIFDRVSCIL